MNIGELIDELLNYNLSDEVSYINIFITAKNIEWNLTKSTYSDFSKTTFELGDDKGQNMAKFAGIYTNTRKPRRGA